MMVKLGYDRKMICEFYYCHPAYSDACIGTEGGPVQLQPLIDDDQVPRFLSLATEKEKLVHIYAVAITMHEAEAKKKLAHDEIWKEIFSPKSKGVVIEEIEEPPLVVPKRKPRKKAEFNQEIHMIGWYERDIEFEDFLKDSLAKARDKWRKEKDIVKDLLNGFNTNMEQANIGESQAGEGIVVSAIQEPQADDVGEPTILQSAQADADFTVLCM